MHLQNLLCLSSCLVNVAIVIVTGSRYFSDYCSIMVNISDKNGLAVIISTVLLNIRMPGR
ncbi:hypothetical protein GCM10011403_26410 [Pseudohongiella nitratireducens]|uniref:Uncharacterized protein n=1 Tax=Pseudohongiella nitratireducens TaxID=1768907 RepID=A0A916QLM4_9GAMM|nr:hypothetical protein GCM10011403_26410 [Pseudohongiella nitratireducens]